MKKFILAALVLFFSSTVMAQEEVKPLKDPASTVKPEFPDTHTTSVVFPRDTKIVKDRKVVPEGSEKAPDQGYQTACANGEIKRCSGVDFSTLEATIKATKRSLAPIKAPATRTFGHGPKPKKH